MILSSPCVPADHITKRMKSFSFGFQTGYDSSRIKIKARPRASFLQNWYRPCPKLCCALHHPGSSSRTVFGMDSIIRWLVTNASCFKLVNWMDLFHWGQDTTSCKWIVSWVDRKDLTKTLDPSTTVCVPENFRRIEAPHPGQPANQHRPRCTLFFRLVFLAFKMFLYFFFFFLFLDTLMDDLCIV